MSTVVINSYRQAAANWYDGAYAAWQAKGAASLADSYIDLTGNGRHLAVGVAPTWASGTGWIFTGSQYLISPVTPNSTNWTILVRFSNGTTATATTGGLAGSFQYDVWHSHPFLGFNSLVRNGINFTLSQEYTNGILGISGGAAYYNGVNVGTFTPAIVAQYALIVGARATNLGSAGNFATAYIQAVGVWDTPIDAATVATKSAQMAAL